MRHLVSVSAALFLTAAACSAASFTKPPTVAETPEGFRIEFIVDGITDVTVSVTDARGKVVRHLAAGRLGQTVPPPLTKDSYAQTLLWDRRDDAGRDVPPGPYTIQVGLDLTPSFSRLLGASPAACGTVLGLAFDARRSELLVLGALGEGADRAAVLQVRDKAGRYLRTILPYPAGMNPTAVGGLTFSGDRWAPRLYDGRTHTLLPGLAGPLRQQMLATWTGLVFFDNGALAPGGGAAGRRLLRLQRDGAWPADGPAGPPLPDAAGAGHLFLAQSANDVYLYLSGLRRSGDPAEPLHVVFRCRVDSPTTTAVPWLGELGKSGSDDRHFDDPRGLAVDPAGNVYVADRGNSRIAVFDAGGAFLAAIPCTDPDQILLHPKTGNLYVLALEQTPKSLVKFWNDPTSYRKKKLLKLAGWDRRTGIDPAAAGKVLASLNLPQTDNFPLLALDPSSDPPVLWYSEGLARIDQEAGKFKADRSLLSSFRPTGPPTDLAVLAGLVADPTRDEVYVDTHSLTGFRWLRFDGATGKVEPYGLQTREAADLGVGPDGLVYVRYSGRLVRHDRAGKPVTAAGPGARAISLPAASLPTTPTNFAIGHNGDLYVLRRVAGADPPVQQLDVYSAAGALKKSGLVTGLTAGAASPCVDAAGNLYLAEAVKPAGELVPTLLSAQAPNATAWHDGAVNWYARLMGSVLKFGPAGGSLKPTGGPASDLAVLDAGTQPYELLGLSWRRTGCAPISAAGAANYWQRSRLDVDAFGRVFVPNALTAQVQVLDAAGNEIARFGVYGNQDAGLPGAAGAAVGAVPLAWPAYVAVNDFACYVGDPLNARVVRVELRSARKTDLHVDVK
jgi:hypothetical protein